MDITNEIRIEKKLRANKYLIPMINLLVILLLGAGIVLCHYYFTLGYYWTFLPAALLAHSFFIIVIHDGCHRNFTHTIIDDYAMNIIGGLFLFPFHPEGFRKYHIVHHAFVNQEIDPNWTPLKSKLFNKNRFVYIIFQLIPILFTFYGILISGKQVKTEKPVKSPKIRWRFVALAVLCSAATIYFLRPSLWFVLLTLFFLNFFDVVRHWCEHMGTEKGRESNTFWFPLGMGVGNHDAHHKDPAISWVTLAIGLRKREKQTNPFKTFWGMLFRKDFFHYSEQE